MYRKAKNGFNVAGIFLTIFIVSLIFSLLGCEIPEPESGLTKVNISTDLNGLTHMSTIAVPNDGFIVLYVTREYSSVNNPTPPAPQSTYKWHKNGNLIDGEQEGHLSIKGPNSDIADITTVVAHGDTIKVSVTDRGKTVDASTYITLQ